MNDFQYWMIGTILILLILRITLKNFKYINFLILIYSIIVNIIVAWIMHNDQYSFERVFIFGYFDTNSSIRILKEIYLAYYLAILFNIVVILFLYPSKYKRGMS